MRTLNSAIVPSTPAGSAEERESIIDAAYICLSRPHPGAVPVAAILRVAGVSTRAFYRHFASKDDLFLAMLRQESEALARRLEHISELTGGPSAQLETWIDNLFAVAFDPALQAHLAVLDSNEVRAATGYHQLREQVRADRERSLIEILERGRNDGTFPLAVPAEDAVAISALVSRAMTTLRTDDRTHGLNEKLRILDFSLRALGVRNA